MNARVSAASLFAVSFFAAVFAKLAPARAAETVVPFEGEKSAWHEGFDRFDYTLDEATLAITPFAAPDGEKFGIRDPAKGQRRCVVIAPKQAATGNPWSWRGCYFDHQPQTEIELLRRGFHVAYISANATLKPGREWDAWYAFLTEKHGLSAKPAFIGMSRGGEYAYTWATAHPDKVACIYADNPGGNREVFARLGDLAAHDVPLLHVCGSIDPLLGRFSNVIEAIYRELGGRISVMIKDGAGHHPHSLRDPTPLADFIAQSSAATAEAAPDFLGAKVIKSSFYSDENSYRDLPSEGTFITCRGPWFGEDYARFSFELPGIEGAVSVVAPKTAAAGKPWVFRAGFTARDAVVDLALLAKGFHIITAPISYNAESPLLAHWNATYAHFIAHGFSKKPVLEGAGRAAGEVYAWAIANPEKVSCVYAENPVLRSRMSPAPLLEHLAPLAKAGVPLLHVCGSLDPALEDSTRALEKTYRGLGGTITVILKAGEGHYPLAPSDPQPVVDFITARLVAETPEPRNWTAQQDHQNMLEQLGITRLRPGPSGKPDAPNAANYDLGEGQSISRPARSPDAKNGQKVTTPEQWWKQRRPEIVEDFEREVFGRVPKDVPEVTWTVDRPKPTDRVVGERPGARPASWSGTVDNSACPAIEVNIQMTLVTPRDAKGPVPVLMMFGGFGGGGLPRRADDPQPPSRFGGGGRHARRTRPPRSS